MTATSDWVEVNREPFSANNMYQGRKLKTYDYQKFARELLKDLPDIEVPADKIHLKIEVRYRRRNSDLDNSLKPFIDVLQRRLGFNDNRIYKITAIKRIDTEKPGIRFKLEEYHEET